VTDLHATLLAAVEARKARAEAATEGDWFVDDPNDGTDYRPFWMVINDAFVNPPSDDEDVPWLAVELHTGVEADARHIAAENPAFTLRQVARDLAVLQRHRPLDLTEREKRKAGVVGRDSQRPICTYEWNDGDGYVEWFDQCPEITDLADALGIPINDEGGAG
jgi:hypothetical protein